MRDYMGNERVQSMLCGVMNNLFQKDSVRAAVDDFGELGLVAQVMRKYIHNINLQLRTCEALSHLSTTGNIFGVLFLLNNFRSV